MSIIRSLCVIVVLLLPTVTASAQTPVTLITDPDRVRFTTPGTPLEWRLEIANAQSEPIFDSGFIEGKELDWPLIDAKGQSIESGLYTYTLTIRSRGSEVRIQRGQLQIERVRSVYQISALSSDSTSGVIINTPDAGAPPTSVPDLTSTSEPFRRSLSTVSFAAQPLISGSGTTSTMTKWIDGPTGVVGDTNVTEVNGSVVVGNGTFRGNLQIFGPSNKDVFAGMGPNLITGPGFNFGYAGETFGRSAGFFNVRPDGSATPPNPSLRFMTANVERMIITNAGNVGLGTSNPQRMLQFGPSIDALFTVEPSDGSPHAGYIRFGDNTGWKLLFARSRESSGGPLNTGSTTGLLMTIQDNGNAGFPFPISPEYKLSVVGLDFKGLYASSYNGPAITAGSLFGNIIEGLTFGGARVFHITNAGTYVTGSDFAEALPADGEPTAYEPGDVLIISERTLGGVEKATRPYDTRVVGVYSTRPGMLGADKDGESTINLGDVPVAIVGIVPTKVSTENGPVHVGDLLTTSSTSGYAMKASRARTAMGTILGKALEPLNEGRGVIKVLVTLK